MMASQSDISDKICTVVGKRGMGPRLTGYEYHGLAQKVTEAVIEACGYYSGPVPNIFPALW